MVIRHGGEMAPRTILRVIKEAGRDATTFVGEVNYREDSSLDRAFIQTGRWCGSRTLLLSIANL